MIANKNVQPQLLNHKSLLSFLKNQRDKNAIVLLAYNAGGVFLTDDAYCCEKKKTPIVVRKKKKQPEKQ